MTSAATSIGDIAAVYCEQAHVMRYLRMLSNSLVAGALATAYVVVLVLQLNPSLPLSAVRLMALVTTIGLFYAVHLTVIFYIVLVVRQILAST